MTQKPYDRALELFIPLLTKARSYLKDEHAAWDEWAESTLDKSVPDGQMNVYSKAKGFLDCLERFTDLRAEGDMIYDPRWKKARYRLDIAALAMVIVHGKAEKTLTALKALSDDIDAVFKQPPT